MNGASVSKQFKGLTIPGPEVPGPELLQSGSLTVETGRRSMLSQATTRFSSSRTATAFRPMIYWLPGMEPPTAFEPRGFWTWAAALER